MFLRVCVVEIISWPREGTTMIQLSIFVSIQFSVSEDFSCRDLLYLPLMYTNKRYHKVPFQPSIFDTAPHSGISRTKPTISVQTTRIGRRKRNKRPHDPKFYNKYLKQPNPPKPDHRRRHQYHSLGLSSSTTKMSNTPSRPSGQSSRHKPNRHGLSP